MPRPDYKRCRRCRKSSEEVGELSHTRLCAACGAENLLENVDGLVHKRGPAFLRYRRAMVATWGGVLLDDVRRGT